MSHLTILIRTHNRAALLAKALASLNDAARPAAWSVDVLVVANACRDHTHSYLDEYCAQAPYKSWLPLEWFGEPKPGKSNALNGAFARLQSDLVSFVGDDHRIDSDYLLAVTGAAANFPEINLLCGRILPDWDGREPAWVHDQGPYRIYPLPVPRFDLGYTSKEIKPDWAIPGGGDLFLRTPWLLRIGPFATDMGPTGHNLGGSEDLEWILRPFRLGARMRYVPTAIQYHYVDASRLKLPYLVKKAYKRTASTIRIEISTNATAVPKYLFRKALEYALKACTSLSQTRLQYYLVRTAAALVEIAGYMQRRRKRLPAESSCSAD